MDEQTKYKGLNFWLVTEPATEDMGGTIIGAVLQNLADKLGDAIFLKEDGDDLLDWPIGAIIGSAHNLAGVRECPVPLEAKERLLPVRRWEFLIPDKLLICTYCVDAELRGLEYPGPIPPDDFPARVREWFAAPRPDIPLGGWKSVISAKMRIAMTSRPGGAKLN